MNPELSRLVWSLFGRKPRRQVFSCWDSFIKAMVISVIQFCFAFFLLIILKFKTLRVHIIWTSWAHVYSVKDIQVLPVPISVPSTLICRKEAWTPGPGPCVQRSVLPSWFDIRVWLHYDEAKDLTFCHQQGKVRSQNLDETCLKRRYHTG